MRQTVRAIALTIDLFVAVLMGLTVYAGQLLPDSYSVVTGESIRLPVPVSMEREPAVQAQLSITSGGSYQSELRLLGIIPIKSVEVRVVDRKLVRVSGAPFGIKMFTDGLMVVGMSDVAGDGQRLNPARQAGVRIGDIVEQVDGVRLCSNEQLGALVEQSGGRAVRLTLRRDGERLELEVPPLRSVGDGKYRLGVWVRDSSAGIGTLTYYDPNSGLFTGLGHAVCDVDTGELMPLQSGEIVTAEITGCRMGLPGSPGELKGRFSSRNTLGQLCGNTATGVYGYLQGSIYLGEQLPLALQSEVRPGKAMIYTTLEGTIPQAYAVEIETLNNKPSGKGQNMVVKVTDPRLLSKTGGIVQGMSGSPIVQNGMLVGSVTHVFVNDPQRGFGIFAENIAQNAGTVSQSVTPAA
ncbi:MAG: SpoIVB peptidase [Angelakisella sp.]